MIRTGQLAAVRVLSWTVAVAVAWGATASAQVDFQRQIAPIFARSCWRCHGGGDQAEDDMLTSAQRARRGGDSGRDLLALPIESNELIRRVRASEPGDRMPLSGDRLSDPEIELLEAWLESGADWPAPKKPAGTEQHLGPWYEKWGLALVDAHRAVEGDRFLPCALTLGGVLLVGLLARRARRKLRRAEQAGTKKLLSDRMLASISGSIWLNLVLLVALWGAWIQWQRLEEQKRALHLKVVQLTPTNEFSIRYGPKIRPLHPPRMRGEYYRGNDERDPALFNRGFYRTATFRVELRGADGRPLEWSSSWPTAAAVHLEMIQAPFATRALFDPKLIELGGLWDADPWIPDLQGDSRVVHLRPMPGRDDAWEADFPISLDPTAKTARGTVFYYRSLPEVGKPSRGEVHYAIEYDLRNDGGKIGAQSQVWMESLYNVSKIDFPAEGKITPAEWFSAVPIPEIVGGNSSDPELLGIPEHQKSQPPANQ